jgi:flagellar hook-associated protein 1
MSLFSSIRMAGNALQANEIALQVVGQNIANANTVGYLREQAVFKTSVPTQSGNLVLGSGVKVDAIVQQIDKYLENRLHGAISDESKTGTLTDTYSQLEGIVNALGDTDLSSSMTTFFNSISDILNQPTDVSVRNLTVQQGQSLTAQIRQIAQQVQTVRSGVNDQVQQMADNINRLVGDIRNLNGQIAQVEAGSLTNSDAIGLRDQRYQDLEDLSKLVNIQATEQSDGTVSVYVGGEYLVQGTLSRSVKVGLDADRGMSTGNIYLADNNTPLPCSSGELKGLLDSRDMVLGGFIDQFNDFASTLISEFNKAYSSGQGLTGYSSLTSTYAVDDASAPLDEAGLPFTPENGSFQVLLYDTNTKLTTTKEIQVNLTGSDSDTSLQDICDQLSQIPGITAQITASKQLKLGSSSTDKVISFANDTSGFLAAMGLNTFFSGTTASDIGINDAVVGNPSLFAASLGGVGKNTDNAVQLAALVNTPLNSKNNLSLAGLYSNLVDGITQGSSISKASADAAASYCSTLNAQKLSVSGVNLDEEAIDMMTYQHAYQASAKYISTLSDLFDVLVNI